MSSLDEISLRIGGLEERTQALLKHAEDHERETRSLRRDVSDISVKVDAVQKEMAVAMPTVRRVQNWHQRAIGVSAVGGVIGSVITLLVKFKGWGG